MDTSQVHVQHVPTQDAYDQWAHVYDSDGNMLQSIDDIEIAVLLLDMFSHLSKNVQGVDISLLDLGCGTDAAPLNFSPTYTRRPNSAYLV